jgi:hypothetical protein
VADNPNQITGQVYISVNGKVLPLVGSATIRLGGKQREAVVGNAYHGYRESIVPGEADCTFVETGSMTADDIKDIVDATVTVTDDAGRSRTMANAFCKGNIEVNEKGEVKCSFAGKGFDKA